MLSCFPVGIVIQYVLWLFLSLLTWNDTSHIFLCFSIDATVDNNRAGRWVNDSPSPNCNAAMKIVVVDSIPHLCLFAIKDIAPGEELTFDYGVPDLPWRQKVSPLTQGHGSISKGEGELTLICKLPSWKLDSVYAEMVQSWVILGMLGTVVFICTRLSMCAIQYLRPVENVSLLQKWEGWI